MQQILFIDLFKSALHVSGDKLAHLQEHFLHLVVAYIVVLMMHGLRIVKARRIFELRELH